MTTNGTDRDVMSSSPVSGTTPQTVLIKGKRYRQRPLGPAPFASFEDSSDELDSPPESARVPGLPKIKEDPASQLPTPVCPIPPSTNMNPLNLTEEEERGLQEALSGGLDTPAPPRIDISRASSSSQHEDSITSSPEHEGPHNLGYKEDGALDLRSSTEELDYTQESGTVEENETKKKREKMMRKQNQLHKDFTDTQSECEFKERKDSNCSTASDFGGHLYIGGRTSRLSSVGSAASGGSANSAVSHLSGASHLSVGSKMSRGSRSPSPHKMMLETSFCGGKPAGPAQAIDAENAPGLVSHVEKPEPAKPVSRRRSLNTLVPEMVTAVEITPRPSPPAHVAKKTSDKTETEKPQTKPVPVVKKETVKLEMDEIRKADEIVEVSPRPVQRKPLNLAKMMERKIAQDNKPKKKTISLRDIPGDEIFIPLTGPEVDFEEVIRKASPRMARRQPSEDTPDVIYIPLHSPPKEKDVEEDMALLVEKEPKISIGKRSEPINVPQRTASGRIPKAYEKFDDGSIYIPLHTPDEEKGGSSRTFEEEIRRVELELQRVKAVEAEKREREREQLKPATLDLHDNSHSRTRLSSSYPGKQDLLSGSRTPSPGSSLSRKSSFASLFRRSEMTASPDSPACSGARKKSATLSNILKDATDGLRDRSRSRSKSKERLSSSTGVSRSPSFKKNVFGGLFGKKKEEEKGTEAYDMTAPPMDVRFTFTPNATFQGEDRGDYIFIPLRDPNEPYRDPNEDPDEPPQQLRTVGKPKQTVDPQPDVAVADEVAVEVVPTPMPTPTPEPVFIQDIKDSPGQKRRSRDFEDDYEIPKEPAVQSVQTVAATEIEATVEESKRNSTASRASLESKESLPTSEPPESKETATDEESAGDTVKRRPKQVFLPPAKSAIHSQTRGPFVQPRGFDGSLKGSTEVLDAAKLPKGVKLRSESTTDKNDTTNLVSALHTPSTDPQVEDSSLESNTILNTEIPQEEMVSVSNDGVKMLKLPPEPGDLDEDHERKGLVVQDSFEEELPYVPTTLPLERAFGVTIVPAKERISEVKTCPIDRPRSTTPKNPASLDEFLARRDSSRIPDKEKMKISLPHTETTAARGKSPRRFSGKGKSWFEFAEEALQSPRDLRKGSLTRSPSPPPLPPRASQCVSASSPQDFTSCAATSPVAQWINFEDLPEKRKLPKRITTLPMHRGSADGGAAADKSSAQVVYSYVTPEDCQCECHDHTGTGHAHEKPKIVAGMQPREAEANRRRADLNGALGSSAEAEVECEDCECSRNGVVDGSEEETEDLEECPLLDGNSDDESPSRKEASWLPETRLQIEVPHLSDSSFEAVSIGPDLSPSETPGEMEMVPFAMDLDVHSNRSSIISQTEEPSPDSQPT